MRGKLIAFMNAYSHGKSGGDTVFIELAKRLNNDNKIIITSQLGKNLCSNNGIQATYYITSTESNFNNVVLTYIKRLVKALFLNLPIQKNDVLMGTSDFFPDVLPIFLSRLKNKESKWLQHVFHLIPTSRKLPYYIQRLSLFFIRMLADIVIVDNTLLKNELSKMGFHQHKLIVNHPGINLDYLQSIKKNSRMSYEGVYMAQLRKSKGVFDLITIWKLVCLEMPNAQLAIIGKGKKEIVEELKNKIAHAKLQQNITLMGYLEDKQMFSLIKASKIFIFPSHEEGFGISALEAQALGLPVIAWNLPVFTEIFPKGMIRVTMFDMNNFARASLNMLMDKSLRRKFVIEASANAKRYSWGQTAKREKKLIDNLRQKVEKNENT